MPAFALPYRNRAPDVIRKTRPVQKDCYACNELNYDWFAQRPRGALHHAEGQALLLAGPHAASSAGARTSGAARATASASSTSRPPRYDGFGEDWPLGYDDLAPYYDLVEDYVGITGIAEGVYELPDSKFHPPMGCACARRSCASG